MAFGNLFVISGPSGAGKGTLVARVLERVPNTWMSVSATTRKPRKGEQEGIHYFFFDEEQFDELIEQDGFLEWAKVHRNRYGTPVAAVREHLEASENVLLEIDVQGGLQVRERMPECHLVFIDPPSLEELRRRLEARGTESEEVIEERMRIAELEIQRKMQYDFVLVNDDLDVATEQLVAYIESFERENGKDGQ